MVVKFAQLQPRYSCVESFLISEIKMWVQGANLWVSLKFLPFLEKSNFHTGTNEQEFFHFTTGQFAALNKSIPMSLYYCTVKGWLLTNIAKH